MRLMPVMPLVLLAACSGSSDNGAFITASWRFRSVASNVDQGCPDGFPNVVMHAKGTPCASKPNGECLFDLVCEGGTGLSGSLDPAIYDVWLDFVSADGANIFTTTTHEMIDLTLGDKAFSRQILLDGGIFEVSWRLIASDNTTRTCEEAGVYGIYISAVNPSDPSAGNNDEVDCDAVVGYSYPYAVGTYDVTLEAVNDSGQTRGLADTVTGKMIVAPNGLTKLGQIDIQLANNPSP